MKSAGDPSGLSRQAPGREQKRQIHIADEGGLKHPLFLCLKIYRRSRAQNRVSSRVAGSVLFAGRADQTGARIA